MVQTNKLSANASKTNYMILGTPHMVSNIDELDENVILDSTALESQTYYILGCANWWLPYMEKSYWLCLQNNLS